MGYNGFMDPTGMATFETAIGICGLTWREAGLVAVRLPAMPGIDLADQMRRRNPDLCSATPPGWVKRAMAEVTAHLAGGRIVLTHIPLDFSLVGSFEASVYREAQLIPPGETITYGDLALKLGDAGLARAVGQALGRNPWPIVVPCHRITAAAGRTGGFSAPGGTDTKLRLLEIEGALTAETLPLFANAAAP